MEVTTSEDLWTPFKELQSLVERAVSSDDESILDPLQKALQKHKQNFLTILKNPPKDARAREELAKATTEGLGVGGGGVLPRELVDEVTIVSDMYDLNEYMALDLLTTAQSQLPHHPGLTRGLVAVLLYYDGRRALAQSLKVLMQARAGLLWTVDAASPQVTRYVTQYTRELLDADLMRKLLGVLATQDLSKETELLQANRALGGPKHHEQITKLYQETRQLLADIVFLVAAQTGLSKEATDSLLDYLRDTKPQTDASGAIDSVTLALTMGLLYALDVGVLTRRDNADELAGELPLLSDARFVPGLLRELSPRSGGREWRCEGLLALARLALAVTLSGLRTVPPQLQPQGVFEEDEILIDSAVNLKVFQFLNNTFFLNDAIYTEEFYLHRMHNLLTDFIIQMPLKLKELRNKAEDAAKTYNAYTQEGLEPPGNLSHSLEQLFLCLGQLYAQDPLDLQLVMDYWCSEAPHSYSYRTPPRQVSLFKFVCASGEGLPPTLFVPYLRMFGSLVRSPEAAQCAFALLKNNKQSNIAWDHFFNSLTRYFTNLRQEQPPVTDTVYRHRGFAKGITPLEIQGLQAVLVVIRNVAEYSEPCRLALCEHGGWDAVRLLLGLVTCSIPISLKAELLITLASLARSPSTANAIWLHLEAAQILATVPTTSSYQPRGVQTELEEVESRNEEFPLTRGMLSLLAALVEAGPPPRLLGAGARTPGLDPYLNYVTHAVFLRFESRSYKNVQEKWEVCCGCLRLLVKWVSQYDPQPEDCGGQGGASPVSPPPGHHIMAQMCSKSELFRLVLQVVEQGTQLLDAHTVFTGRPQLERATGLCLRLVDAALRTQLPFLAALKAAGSSLLLTGLNKLLLTVNPRSNRPDHLLHIAKYVTYNGWLPGHALSAVRVFAAVTAHPTQQSLIVSVLTPNQQTATLIRHGFVECLETDDEMPASDDGEPGGEVGRTKEAILKLLLQCLRHPAPNLAHYLLGFNLDKDVAATNLQPPGVLGFPVTCLHAVMSLLNTSLRARCDVTCSPISPRIADLCYRLVYSLAADVRASDPTLRFLRSSDFVHRHLAALPARTDSAHVLTQAAWLLKTVAIELKVTAAHQQVSQLGGLVRALVEDRRAEGGGGGGGGADYQPTPTPALAHSFKNDIIELSAPHQRLVLQLLNAVSFNLASVVPPQWEFFEQSQLDALVTRCESGSGGGGVRVIDLKRLHRLLMDELAAIQGSSTVAQRQLILREIQSVLSYVGRLNRQRHLAAATVNYLDAWRQTTEVLFSVAPTDALPFPLRFSLLLQIIFELLTKVLSSTVLAELAVITSGAVLLLFVNVRNCFAAEMGKSSVAHGGGGGGQLEVCMQAKENVLNDIMACLLKWILSSVSSQKLRANLYASLLSLLQLSQWSGQGWDGQSASHDPGYVDLLDSPRPSSSAGRQACVQVLVGYGERLLGTLCQDFSSGHDVCKMLSLSCLDVLMESDPHGQWASFLSGRGYLKYLVDSLLASDADLSQLLSPAVDNLRPLYVYESKMALLCRVAATRSGAELLLEQNCLACLSAMRVFDNHPDIGHHTLPHSRYATTQAGGGVRRHELDFVPSVSVRYLQLLSPALTLCQTILSSLGVDNQSAVSQVLHLLLSHGDTVTQVLRCGSPFLQPEHLKELSQLTAVIARATNRDVVERMAVECGGDRGLLLESVAHFHKIRRLMLALLARFVLSETTLKELTGGVEPTERADIVLTFMQVAGNLVMYARNLVAGAGVDRPATAAVLQPTLLEPTLLDKKVGHGGGETSLGVAVQQMVQCVAHCHREKAALDLLQRKALSIPDLNSTTVKDFLPFGVDRWTSVDECKQQAQQHVNRQLADKRAELDQCRFIVDNCLYLVWAHLDYYMLRAIPDSTLGITRPQDRLHQKARTSQMGEITWCVTVDEINKLKQGLISVFNDTFCKNLISVTQDQNASDRGFVEALIRRVKKLIQFVPNQ